MYKHLQPTACPPFSDLYPIVLQGMEPHIVEVLLLYKDTVYNA